MVVAKNKYSIRFLTEFTIRSNVSNSKFINIEKACFALTVESQGKVMMPAGELFNDWLLLKLVENIKIIIN